MSGKLIAIIVWCALVWTGATWAAYSAWSPFAGASGGGGPGGRGGGYYGGPMHK